MGFFDTIFNHKKNAVNQPKSRYTSQILQTAFEAARQEHLTGEDADELTMNFEIESYAYDIELYLHISLEQSAALLTDLFQVLPYLDAHVQNDGPDSGIDNYVIGSIDVYCDKVTIEYYGAIVNTQFDINLNWDHNTWYCNNIGLRQFQPPVAVLSLGKEK